MDSFCDNIERISYLARAESRVRVLNRLSTAEPVDRRELCASLSLSRSAVVRAVDSLEDRGWVAVEADRVRLTPVGRLVIEEFLDLVGSIETITDLAPFLEWFPLSEYDLDATDLQDGTVTVALDGDPYAPAREHTNRIRTADRFRALLPSIGQDAITEAHRGIVAGELESTLIVSPAVERRIQSDQFAPQFEEMLSTGRLTVLVAESIPFFLGLADDRTTQIGVEDDDGLPRALLDTSNERVRSWGEELFTDYRRSASDEIQL